MKLVQFVPWTNKNKYRIMTHYKAVHVARKLIEDGGKKALFRADFIIKWFDITFNELNDN
jgi:hypothetical protein